jgi:hypothetical protein
MSFPYHGNWCGPGWSDGRNVPSTHGFAPAIDEFDETCRQHDFALSGGRSDLRADLKFARLNVGRGAKRTVAAVAVLGRALVDQLSAVNKNATQHLETMTKPALRGTAKQQPRNTRNPTPHNRSVAAPVAIGSMVRAVKTQHIQTKNGAILRGTDFLSPVEGNGVTTFGLGKSALLSPAYFLSTFLGNMARSFEKYRWNKLRVHYVPKVATSAAGQIVLCSSHSVSEPCLQGEAGTFLQRAMSQGNAAMGPLWMENFIDIDVKKTFYMVDPTTTSDPDDAVAEELQVYTQTAVAGQVGYLYAEYEIEFSELTYQPHAAILPLSTGPGLRATLTEQNAVNAINDDWALIDPAGTLGLGTTNNGTIFRAVLDIQGSAIFTGGTFSAGLGTTLYSHTTTAAITAAVSPMPLVGGLTIYLVVSGSLLYAYSSLESAVSGAGSGQLAHRLASTAVGSYNFDVAIVRIGMALLPTVQ